MSDVKKALLEKMCDWLEQQPEYEGDRLMLLISDEEFSGLLLHNYGPPGMEQERAVQDVVTVFDAIFCDDCGEFHPREERSTPPLGGFSI
jgi:hypothetical protein